MLKYTCVSSYYYTGLPRSGKTFWKMKKIPGQGKVREFHLQSGKSSKNEKAMEKSGKIKVFPKKLLVKGFWKFYFP